MLTMLTEGFLVSLQIFAFTLIGAVPLGIVVGVGAHEPHRAGALDRAHLYIYHARARRSCCRCLPSTLRRTTCLASSSRRIPSGRQPSRRLSSTTRAYFAEIYRSGPAVDPPRGQYEAAEVLGYTRVQTFAYIVLPQVVKRILPAMGNEIITLVKDTSLAFSIARGRDVLHRQGARRPRR